ncbi:MAG: flagellar biosynthesis protein FlgC [Rhodospirillales bacterium]|nr:flagellar biosynthesis protein FlgC [Rhodospirillales bacterium]
MNVIQSALSGLHAASKKIEAGASNIANLQTSGSLEAGKKAPYSALTTRQTAITDAQGNGLGVKVDIVAKDTPFVPAYDPDSPFANTDGEIGVPNVDLAEEAVNINLAEITYKANLKTLQAASDMEKELLGMFDEKV